jgi:predicted regulator of Ras-like GTPase activity (Roadblock/LC7/MglB family)
VINEFRNISPEVTKAYIFKKDGEIEASIDDNLAEERVKKIASSFDDIAGQAGVIGGLEVLTIQGVSSQLEITSTNNRYLATIASRTADEKMVRALTHIIIPTVIKLLDQIEPIKPNDTAPIVEPAAVEETAQPPAPEKPPREELPPKVKAKLTVQAFPKAPVNQLLVEKISGLLVASDVVRVDWDVVAKWSDLYSGKEVTHVAVETLEGKITLCKFKPIKEAGNTKGIIQIPEKILQVLGTAEGKLVMVKPFVAAGKEEEA